MTPAKSSRLWSAVVGSLSGARTVCAPLLVSQRLRAASTSGRGAPLRLLQSRGLHRALVVAAALELVVDKLPFAGNRTASVGVVARMLSGGLAGAAVTSVHDGAVSSRRSCGAMHGAAGAFVATFATSRMRRRLQQQMGLPNVVAGLVEDALIYGVGRWLVARALPAR